MDTPCRKSVPFVEPFVDAAEAGQFLKLHPVTVQRLARAGILPSHPLQNSTRKHWRFLLSELGEWLQKKHIGNPDMGDSVQ